jgi:callose synthase
MVMHLSFGALVILLLNLLFNYPQETLKNRGGTAPHSAWRNYDDLNEYFW